MTDKKRLANTLLDWQAAAVAAMDKALDLDFAARKAGRWPMTESQWSRFAKLAEKAAKTARDAENTLTIDRMLRSLERELASKRKSKRREA